MSNASESNDFPVNRWGAPIGDGVVHLHDHDFDYEDFFERRDSGELSEDEKGDIPARVYGIFCRDFFKSGGDPAAIQPWVASYIAKKLHEALGGVPWDDIMGLPWDEPTPRFTAQGRRALDTYTFICNMKNEQPDAKTTDLIAAAAQKNNVSYESARADYYSMKKGIEQKTGVPSKFLIPRNDF